MIAQPSLMQFSIFQSIGMQQHANPTVFSPQVPTPRHLALQRISSRASTENSGFSRVVGIDLGTTNSAVAVGDIDLFSFSFSFPNPSTQTNQPIYAGN